MSGADDQGQQPQRPQQSQPEGRRAAILQFALGEAPPAPDIHDQLEERYARQVMQAAKGDDVAAFRKALNALLGVWDRGRAKAKRG